MVEAPRCEASGRDGALGKRHTLTRQSPQLSYVPFLTPQEELHVLSWFRFRCMFRLMAYNRH
jgi:hypothetical protein